MKRELHIRRMLHGSALSHRNNYVHDEFVHLLAVDAMSGTNSSSHPKTINESIKYRGIILPLRYLQKFTPPRSLLQ